MRGLFDGQFDRDPADSFWTERDDPLVCPYCGERLERAGDGSLSCDDCELEWASAADVERSRKAIGLALNGVSRAAADTHDVEPDTGEYE